MGRLFSKELEHDICLFDSFSVIFLKLLYILQASSCPQQRLRSSSSGISQRSSLIALQKANCPYRPCVEVAFEEKRECFACEHRAGSQSWGQGEEGHTPGLSWKRCWALAVLSAQVGLRLLPGSALCLRRGTGKFEICGLQTYAGFAGWIFKCGTESLLLISVGVFGSSR